jgi:hypothetical protein
MGWLVAGPAGEFPRDLPKERREKFASGPSTTRQGFYFDLDLDLEHLI